MPRLQSENSTPTFEDGLRVQAHRELLDLLQKVSEGKLTPEDAEKKVLEMGHFAGSERSVKEGFQQAFEKLKRSALGFQKMQFVCQEAGVDATLSSLRNLQKDDDCKVARNHVVGCQWFQVSFLARTHFAKNLFTAVQLSELIIIESILEENVCSLARLSNSTVRQSELRNNRINRSSFSDVISEQCFMLGNRIQKSGFLQVNFTDSQLVGCRFVSVEIKDCEFMSSRIESVVFEDCTFTDCSFDGFSVLGKKDCVVKGLRCVGLHFEGSMTWDQFCEATSFRPS